MKKLSKALQWVSRRAARGQRPPRRPAGYAPALEPLEGRWLPSGLVGSVIPGIQNTYQDISREHIYYQDGAAGLQQGDVILGFLQLGIDATPPGGNGYTPKSTYILYSAQVAGFAASQFGAVTSDNTGTFVVFQPTPTTDPHSLQSVLSGVLPAGDLPAGTLAAVVENVSFNDLVVNNPTPPGATAQMQDYLTYLAGNGTFDATAGFSDWTNVSILDPVNGKNDLIPGDNDYFFTQLGQVAGAQLTGARSTSTELNSLGNGVTFGNIFGGLSVLVNNTPFAYAKAILGQDAQPHQIVYTQAAVAGGNNLLNFSNWGLRNTADGNNGTNTSGNDAGVSDNASVSFFPTAVAPAIEILKLTNGTNNDSAPVAGTPDGPLVQAGSTVTWTYNVTNPGTEPIANVVVTDSVAGVNPTPVLSGGFNVGDTNHNNLLDPGETWQFTASGTAQLGQYSNVGTVTGTSTVTNTPVTANNPDHYFGVDVFIQIAPLTPVNEVTHNGINHAETFTITVTALPGTGQLDAADVSFSTPTISYPLGAPDLAGPTSATFVSRAGNVATYTVTINSDRAGTFEVKASDTVTFTSSMSPNSPFRLTRTTGDGFSDANGSDSPDAVKNYVNALIRITPLTATNPVNTPHTFTITVTAFPAGTGTPTFGTPTVNVSPTPDLRNGPVTPLSGPTNNGNGTWTETWTYTINSDRAGTFIAQASDTVTMGGVTVTRATADGFTSGNGSDGPNAVKTYITIPKASLFGCVFLDLNNNGVEDAADLHLANVGVTLYRLVGAT